MKIDVLTIFPEFFAEVFEFGIIRRAKLAEIVEISVHDIREYATDKHKMVDDRPFGGGDGMVLDLEGRIYLTAGEGEAAGVYIFTPDGAQVGFIHTPETPGNCTFGGPGLRTLYVAASSSLYRIRLGVPGLLAFPPA